MLHNIHAYVQNKHNIEIDYKVIKKSNGDMFRNRRRVHLLAGRVATEEDDEVHEEQEENQETTKTTTAKPSAAASQKRKRETQAAANPSKQDSQETQVVEETSLDDQHLNVSVEYHDHLYHFEFTGSVITTFNDHLNYNSDDNDNWNNFQQDVNCSFITNNDNEDDPPSLLVPLSEILMGADENEKKNDEEHRQYTPDKVDHCAALMIYKVRRKLSDAAITDHCKHLQPLEVQTAPSSFDASCNQLSKCEISEYDFKQINICPTSTNYLEARVICSNPVCQYYNVVIDTPHKCFKGNINAQIQSLLSRRGFYENLCFAMDFVKNRTRTLKAIYKDAGGDSYDDYEH
ncbi:unnamed protein product [Didymodactylos carnosus]|uniref:Uncharacterized protein n=1 Tax=Didymodactylos carnosus TaxID=1234261 RepID=A0A8S2P9Z4_9BILA|nr:unnamed protein product [Didymodactylos carnosus]CAF4042643.1 unnamed protein product [Didymodactylos carnosus]